MKKSSSESQTIFPPYRGWMGKVSRRICFLSDSLQQVKLLQVETARGDGLFWREVEMCPSVPLPNERNVTSSVTHRQDWDARSGVGRSVLAAGLLPALPGFRFEWVDYSA